MRDMNWPKCHAYLPYLFFLLLSATSRLAVSQASTQTHIPVKTEKVILDTDIGDDIDDAFALALALRSPELEILQINSDFGDTRARDRILDRFLAAVGRSDILVATGVQSAMPESHFKQRRYGERAAAETAQHPDAVTATLNQIRKYPGQITLIAIGPLFNVGAMIDRDPETFRKLKRVVMMGGSIYLGYGDLGYSKPHGPDPEWNILQDIPGAQKLLASGVPIYMMPLDATQLKMDEVNRATLFKYDSPLTDQLLILYQQWGALTPTLYDPVAVGYAINPDLCPTQPLRISVDAAGYTRVQEGQPNVHVCLHSDPELFFNFYMQRLLNP
jgi:inosine-uridine nucleoside N-ribohydrolase